MNEKHYSTINFTPTDNRRLAILSGERDTNLRQIEHEFGVVINTRGSQFQIMGNPECVEVARSILKELYQQTEKTDFLAPAEIHLHLKRKSLQQSDTNHPEQKHVEILTKVGVIRAHTHNQRQYLKNISEHDITFSIGPAGTGKTYLAVASAVDALEKEQIKRILLVRPAVEAGERLGFLPGDISEKVDPYLRPLYDALFEMLGGERVAHLLEQHIIEIAPLAFMRGRTLNDSFVILDESQNTTIEQMKMFLTRIGFGSKAIITGDVTQIDLPKGKKSGLVDALEVLDDIDGISFTFFEPKDVMRHSLVQRIIEAYDERQQSTEDNS